MGGALAKLGKNMTRLSYILIKSFGLIPAMWMRYMNKGVTLAGHGRYDEAIACYDMVLEDADVSHRCPEQQGGCLCRSGRV